MEVPQRNAETPRQPGMNVGNGIILKVGLEPEMFTVGGGEFRDFGGGPSFSFAVGMSLMVMCRTQREIDRLWEKLTKGGQPGPCGWLTDRWGVSWQIIPTSLGKMLSDAEHGNTEAAVKAMLKMGKLDIATLERAYRQRR